VNQRLKPVRGETDRQLDGEQTNRVVNLITGLSATDEVSLYGSPTVSPTMVASCRAVPLACRSTSTIFLALSQAPPAFAMKSAW